MVQISKSLADALSAVVVALAVVASGVGLSLSHAKSQPTALASLQLTAANAQPHLLTGNVLGQEELQNLAGGIVSESTSKCVTTSPVPAVDLAGGIAHESTSKCVSVSPVPALKLASNIVREGVDKCYKTSPLPAIDLAGGIVHESTSKCVTTSPVPSLL